MPKSNIQAQRKSNPFIQGSYEEKISDAKYFEICKRIAESILNQQPNNKQLTIKEINKIIKNKCSEINLNRIPKNTDIIKLLPDGNPYKKILKVKPLKTQSGIVVIPVQPMPFECPHGKCIYCPGGVEANTPLSYIGTEPITRVAQKLHYDPYGQVSHKLNQLVERGHNIDKAELVIVGGTFPFYPETYQKHFVKRCFDALNSWNSKSDYTQAIGLNDANAREFGEHIPNEELEKSKKINETSKVRCVGLTIETKPDFCKLEHINTMLGLGTTRIEIGVQSLSNKVYRHVNRGHTLQDVFDSFYYAKNSGFKIVAHMMPGLPSSSIEEDVNGFRDLFEDDRLKPDMLKIYPTLVLKNTGLYKLYLEKKYSSYSIEEFVDILIEVKKIVPPWVRIMRIQREIETSDIVSGPKVGNLRQMVINELKRRGVTCRCIRCREIGLSNINDKRKFETKDIELHRIEYNSSNGKEIFLSFDTKDNKVIFGFLRLRILSDPQRKELGNKLLTKFVNKMYVSAIVRELHVYGPLVNINSNTYHDSETSNNSNQSSEICLLKSNELYQHKGLGRRLLEEAERICKDEFDINKLSVISAVGTREYYKKFGYVINGPYVTKVL